MPQPAIPGVDPGRLASITAEPRRYGFHGTLKAPFRLVGSRTREDLVAALVRFARRRVPFDAPPLILGTLREFLCLVPAQSDKAVQRLAEACVMELDLFRAPPDDTRRATRERRSLSAAQRALLDRWGYAYVMEEFRFHLTLTDRLDPEERETVRAGLAPLVESFSQERLRIDSLCLFEQAERDAPFRLTVRFPFEGRG